MKGQSWFRLGALGLGALSLGAPASLGANIQFTKTGRVVVRPYPQHEATQQQIEIVESEDCPVTKISETEIQVPEACKYLGGIYRYLFDPKRGESKHAMVTGFSVARQSAGSHVFLVSSPLELLP